MNSEPRIAFVLDSLPSIGGAEKVLFAALEAYPRAELFSLTYNKKVFAGSPIARRTIHTSWLDSLPLAHSHHRYFLPLMPAVVERIPLQAYDIVVSFNYAVANGAKNHNGARHLSYTHTPMRYAWTDLNLNGIRVGKNRLIDFYMGFFRAWDRKAASRIESMATNSRAVSQRIRRAYGREAAIIYPPVEVDRFRPGAEREPYFITVTRLVPHKRVDVLIEAFNQLKLPLVIAGDGPELPRLKMMAKSNISFPGFQPDNHLADLMGKARAFVCAAEEDFGIAIVEAQAAGCPVIAYGSGGALETVQDGISGILFGEQTAAGLMDAVHRFEQRYDSFHPGEMAERVRSFSKSRFIDEFRDFVSTPRIR